MDTITDHLIVSAGVGGLCELYRTARATPTQIIDRYYSRISAHNDRLGAFIHLRQTEARAEAQASAARWAAQTPLSLLDGVPVAVKANIAVGGQPFHGGMRAYAGRIAQNDAACIAALRSQGAVILGLLNMDEGALGGTGDNPWFGRTQNPYAQGFTAGGSSAGAAAAVSAGLCAAAIATDTMGSVRIPAGFCGCFGYKPSRDFISLEGVIPLSPRFDTVGVLARSVTDCARVAYGASDAPYPPMASASEEITIGMPIDWGGIELDRDLRIAIDALIKQAQIAGASMAPLDFGPYDFNTLRRRCLLVIEAEAMRGHPRLALDATGFSGEFVKMLRWGSDQPKEKLEAAYDAVAIAADFIKERLSKVTALLLPTTPGQAFKFTAGAPSNLGAFAATANIAGLAAIAIPVGLSGDGLPLSVQCIGLTDDAALTAAAFLFRIAPLCPSPP